MEINIAAPKGFDFLRTVNSHGWYSLPPFEFDDKTRSLVRTLDTGARRKKPVTAVINGRGRKLRVKLSRSLDEAETAKVVRDVRRIFRLDDDLNFFYKLVENDEDFLWVARSGAGRLLRSPTVFEDLVKSICTTNCSWSLTEKMVASLVHSLGRAAEDGRRAFPTPEAMAAQSADFYRETVRSGYRATYLKELAERVASGELDVESWNESSLTTEELKREMKRVKGVGDYAAENLLKLVGRYDVLALDSWVRAKFKRTRNGGRPCDDKRIARFYSKYGEWRGLALWCDMTRDWFD